MLDVRYNLKPENVGSELVPFIGDNGVEITTSEGKTYTVLPVAAQDYFTAETGTGYERAYFFIKFFSAVDGDSNTVTHIDPSSSAATITFTGTADPLGLGDRRFKTIDNGQFNSANTDTNDRTIPASSGPVRQGKLNLSDTVTGATHFFAWIEKY